jgi:L-ascorbate metabolism protein UlaG (beta-lactamase superfamily)
MNAMQALRGSRRRHTLAVMIVCIAAAATQLACSAPALSQPTIATREPSLTIQPEVDGRFHNPPGSPTTDKTWRDSAALWWWFAFGAGKSDLQPAMPPEHALAPQQAQAQLAAHRDADSLTWLGHAAFLIRLAGRTILVDPYLGDYASPIDGIGPRRFAGPGLTVDQLPAIDTLVVSHNHYDHLDLRTIARLPNKDRIKVIVPRGTGALLRESGYTDVTEVTWGDVLDLGDALTLRSVPAVHFSARGLFDRDEALWSGYVFESPRQRLYFAGDTAYHPALFKQLREAIGPVDIALVPIGAYEPRKLMTGVHVDPDEAVRLAHDLGARTLVGMHWGTIVLAREPPLEPPRRFRVAGRALGYADPALWVMAIGETRALPPAGSAPAPAVAATAGS